MSNYVTTNIRLPEEDYLRLKEEAAKKRTSLSAVIREKVSEKISVEEYKKKLLKIKGDWLNPAEIAKNRKQVEDQLKRLNLG